ncbi:MAG: CocE/NonD family hydrolase, partial [Acidobacteriota bacterium]
GLLSETATTSDSGQDDYTVDYSTTSGPATRWHNGRGGNFEYSDMAGNDAKGLTYTTAPLQKNIQVTGHPVIHLWVTTTADDGDFFAYLEEVDESGFSHYLTEGVLRASHRKLSAAPYAYMNLPYHRSFAEDIEPLTPGEPVELVFDLHPTSNIFDAGHRIRVTITCADQTSFETPELSPAPMVSVFRNAQQASFIELPLIAPEDQEEAAKGVILTTTLIIGAIIFVVIVLVIFLRARLRK